jgi:protein involved in polysaccharide export with SLBB domain
MHLNIADKALRAPIAALALALWLAAGTGGAWAQSSSSSSSDLTNLNAADANSANSGPVRLRQNQTVPSDRTRRTTDRDSQDELPCEYDDPSQPNGQQNPAASNTDARTADTRNPDGTRTTVRRAPRCPVGEFEKFVQRQAGSVPVRRFGADLMTRRADPEVADGTTLVPADYPVAPGDELLVTLWGSVDADLRLIVDRAGQISIPRVGAVQVGGVRYAELQDVVSRRVARVFKNYQLTVSMGALRGIRIFVTGFVTRPGAYEVRSLATVTAALFRAGGPSPAGSFRRIEIRRGAQAVGTFDLYDFILRGDRSTDRILQGGDVVHVPAVGDEIGLIGSVNRPAVLELKPGETVGDVLKMGGGFTAVADRTRLAVERLTERAAARIRELSLPAELQATLSHGDILRAFSAVDSALPLQQQNKRVRIEGEVARPGDYVLPPSSTVVDALRAAGGLTTSAYVYGTEFNRESVRLTQQENYDRALRDLETDFTRQGTQRTSTADEANANTVRAQNTTRLVERLRSVRPTGRIVLQMAPTSTELPPLALEDGDRIYIPPKPTTVGVFGSVFNGGSYLFGDQRTLDDYSRLAGGPTRGADESSMFVIRANGSVISNLQGKTGWFSSGQQLGALKAEPGDTIFVPEEINRSTFVQSAKDWTQILYQFGLGVAGIKAVGL